MIATAAILDARGADPPRGGCGDRVRVGFPMAPLTTFRIGGPAALYLEPEDDDDLDAASRPSASRGLPFVVLGKGSNVLVADDGVPRARAPARAALPLGRARR